MEGRPRVGASGGTGCVSCVEGIVRVLQEKLWAVIESMMFLLVSVRPKTPTLSRSPSDATIESGTAVTLTCATLSSGSVTYTFTRDGSTQVQSSSSATYDLSSAATSDTGSYTCVASISSVDSVASNADAMTVVGEYDVKL